MPSFLNTAKNYINKMNILVTGANGQLGKSLRKISGDFPQHGFLFVDYAEMDVTNRVQIGEVFDAFTPNLVINCAAYTAVEKAESEKEQADEINHIGAKNIAKFAKQFNAKLIHISTDYVFDGQGDVPFDEQQTTNPQNVYGVTKLAGEQAVKDINGDAIIIRTSWLYSEFGDNFLKTMLRVGSEKENVCVVDDQYGTPTYAANLANAILYLADRQVEGCSVFHYSDEGMTTWYGFAREIFEQANMDVELIPVRTCDYPTVAKRPCYSVLSKNKIKSAGVELLPWQEGVRACLEALGVRIVENR